MAKKIVRGITDVKTITEQDFDTNNVNDLLSDGQYNYIHRKKGKSEEYHNLTDNIKTISSDNTELLSVTNNNKTTNTATLHPKHDAQKEQVLESTRNTVTINHGANGTAEKTTVDTNPEKVLEHENLLTDYGISKKTTGNTTKLGLEYTSLKGARFDLNNLENGKVRSDDFVNAPSTGWLFVSSYSEGVYAIQRAIKLDDDYNTVYVRRMKNGTWKPWREQVGDKSVIDDLLAQKEQLLESTRNTVTINHDTNGTAEKTKVDTNPKKVLEHDNLISDSEYITLNHQTGENTTHIQTTALKEKLDNLQQNKQDVLTAGTGITIQGQTISATAAIGEGASLSFQEFGIVGIGLYAVKYSITSGNNRLTQFTFECAPGTREFDITGALKNELLNFMPNGNISSGAITIKATPSSDGIGMKLVNSNYAADHVYQQETLTFYIHQPGGGGTIS